MGNITVLAFFLVRNYLLWLLVSQMSAHCGGEDVEEQISGHQGSKRPKKGVDKEARTFSSDGLPPKAPPSAFHHLLIMPSYYESDRALIC